MRLLLALFLQIVQRCKSLLSEMQRVHWELSTLNFKSAPINIIHMYFYLQLDCEFAFSKIYSELTH